MTKKFDDFARMQLLSSYEKPDLSSVSPEQLAVERITPRDGRGYISAFHYSRTFPDSTLYVFGLFYNDKVVGVCTFGMGCGKNQYTAIVPDIKNGEYLELTRLWVEDTLRRNTESWFISRCLKLLPRTIKMVVSFSDEKQGHVGTIYQAANFVYLGKNKGGKMLVTKDGIEKHPRLLGIYRARHPEYSKLENSELMKLLGYSYITGGAKHRYVYFRDAKLRKRILKTIHPVPYPKKHEV